MYYPYITLFARLIVSKILDTKFRSRNSFMVIILKDKNQTKTVIKKSEEIHIIFLSMKVRRLCTPPRYYS